MHIHIFNYASNETKQHDKIEFLFNRNSVQIVMININYRNRNTKWWKIETNEGKEQQHVEPTHTQTIYTNWQMSCNKQKQSEFSLQLTELILYLHSTVPALYYFLGECQISLQCILKCSHVQRFREHSRCSCSHERTWFIVTIRCVASQAIDWSMIAHVPHLLTCRETVHHRHMII